MKKKISLLTSAVMLSAALMNGSAYAEEDTPEVKTIVIGGIIYSYTVDENYSWYDDETEKFITIVGAQNAKGEVKLPLSLEDYPVTNVGSKAFFNNLDFLGSGLMYDGHFSQLFFRQELQRIDGCGVENMGALRSTEYEKPCFLMLFVFHQIVVQKGAADGIADEANL